MFAYYSFKALTGEYPKNLKSPQRHTAWAIDPSLGLPSLPAEKGSFDKGWGVYAGTIDEAKGYAQKYKGDVYLVVPKPGLHAVVGEAGWRAEAAVCLGPLTDENSAQIALLVLGAHLAGLPQVRKALHWALYQEGMRPTDKHGEVVRMLVDSGDAKYLYLAGLDWPDEAYSDAILRALVESKSGRYLYLAGKNWPDRRYDKSIAEALIATKDAQYLYLAGESWPKGRFSAEITYALAETRDAKYLYLAGRKWPSKKYNRVILRALLECADMDYLCLAGKHWSQARYSDEILKALLTKGEARHLYLAGCDWPDGRFCRSITDRLIELGEANWIYLSGVHWLAERISEDLYKWLLNTNDDYYIEVAKLFLRDGLGVKFYLKGIINNIDKSVFREDLLNIWNDDYTKRAKRSPITKSCASPVSSPPFCPSSATLIQSVKQESIGRIHPTSPISLWHWPIMKGCSLTQTHTTRRSSFTLCSAEESRAISIERA